MPRVLLVDDEPNIRLTMSELLRREGYDAVAASDYDSAAEAIEHAAPDAALVDIVLPGRSGIDLLKLITSRDPDVPVIIITGEPRLSQVPEIVRAGAYDFLCKPIFPEVLLNAVSRAVERKQLTDEKRRLEAALAQHVENLEETAKERSRELSEALNFLKTVLDSSTEYAIVATDLEGRIELFNRGAEIVFHRVSEDSLGKGARQVLGENYPIPGVGTECETNGERGSRCEVELCRSDGQTFFASVTLTQICEASGPVTGYLGIIRDLTEQRKSEEAVRKMRAQLELNERIAALGGVAAQVAHEVKNPLAGLQLYALHLKSKGAGRLAQSDIDLVDKIVDGIGRLTLTVNEILSFARPIQLAPQPVNVGTLVRDALRVLEPQISARRVQVVLNIDDPGLTAVLDEASISSTLVNLALNAVEAMPDGGQLTASVSRSEDRLRIAIADTGVGMSESQLERAFEPFYTTKRTGLGLGLPYARRIVSQHSGRILVDSRLGAGTLVELTLPAEEQQNNATRSAGSR